MDVIITAGGIPLVDQHLYEFTQGGYKVMIDILGKPMIQWVLDAIDGSKQVNRIIIAGLPKETRLKTKRPLIFLENQGDLLANIQYAAEKIIRLDPAVQTALVVSGDVPGITTPMVDWVIERVKNTNWDFVYTVVDKNVIEKVFPGSKRTFTKLKDIEVCGGDIVAIRPQIMLDTKAKWRKIIESRKSAVKQAALIGFDTLLLLLLKQITLSQAEQRVSKRLNVSAKVFLAPHAEMGMDVDKTFQLEMIRKYLRQRIGK
jgi:GTP:adenosylcobinamide-phosphate guanylyltransferase